MTDTNYNLIMAYPASEAFALSSLGYMWLGVKIDGAEVQSSDGEITRILVTRVSTDKPDFNIKTCGAISFSLSFDFDFMGVFEILEKNKIPFLSSERGDDLPLIFAGGPVITTNPEPLKRVFDFMIIGDGEECIKTVVSVLSKNLGKKDTLKELAELEGVYVPDYTEKIKKVTEPLNDVIYTPIVSDKSYFKNTFIIELARGCMNRCAFCTASYVNLPFRYYEYERIIEAIELGLSKTNKIALLGAQISAHPQFERIMQYLNAKMDSGMCIELGISSLRTDSVTPELVQILVKGGQRTSTIAIEAASERLRKFINKNLKEEQILNAVKIARENGLRGLKIYSMIGIPTETQEDIDEFIRLAKKIKDENKGFEITFSFSTFVPKPQTPFQWSPREDTKSLEKKQKYLEKELAKIGVDSKFSSVKWDYWQTVISRGDESLTPMLIDVYKQGGKSGAYKSALKQFNVNTDKIIGGYDIEDELPWDFIENYPPKQLLINEYNRLLKRI